MYCDQDLIRNNHLRLRYNERELEELNLAVSICGEQRAQIIRNLSLEWARNLIASTPAHIVSRKSFGVVGRNGEIKYRFAA